MRDALNSGRLLWIGFLFIIISLTGSMWVMPQVVPATLGLFFVCGVNIAFPILLVNRKSDKNIENPIFLFFTML